jgi:hypothetical protein
MFVKAEKFLRKTLQYIVTENWTPFEVLFIFVTIVLIGQRGLLVAFGIYFGALILQGVIRQFMGFKTLAQRHALMKNLYAASLNDLEKLSDDDLRAVNITREDIKLFKESLEEL